MLSSYFRVTWLRTGDHGWNCSDRLGLARNSRMLFLGILIWLDLASDALVQALQHLRMTHPRSQIGSVQLVPLPELLAWQSLLLQHWDCRQRLLYLGSLDAISSTAA